MRHIEQQILDSLQTIKALAERAKDIKFEFVIPSGTRYYLSDGEARVVIAPQ